MTCSEAQFREFILDFWALVKTVEVYGLQTENKVKQNVKKNFLKHRATRVKVIR